MSKEKLLDHDYDGIQEYDNDLPKWWVWLFYITVIWGIGYTVYFHFSGRDMPVVALEKEMEELKKIRAAADKKDAGTFNLAAEMKDASNITSGQKVYIAKCAACHGQKGEGLVGPNLTDNAWIHGGSAEAIMKTINEGVPAKGMLAWKTLMPKKDIVAVTAYLVSIKNTNIAGKPPEGDPE